MKSERFFKSKRKKKLLLVLPLLVIPFLTMAFWALGGGKGHEDKPAGGATGLNPLLPDAQLREDKGGNKLSYYEQAEKDSVKWSGALKNDPFFMAPVDSLLVNSKPYALQPADYNDTNEQKVYQSLARLNSHLQKTGQNKGRQNAAERPSSDRTPAVNKEEVDRLEAMIRTASAPAAADPEVEQLNGMLDRIMAIQHPGRITQRLNELGAAKEEVSEVSNGWQPYTVSLLDTGKIREQDEQVFYGFSMENGGETQNAISAVVHQTQRLTEGAVVKMRLLQDITINGERIAKGSFVFGEASLQGERLLIEVRSIRKDNTLYPVKLQVYDLDGIEGIFVPGAITGEVAKQSADNFLQRMEMGSVDPSFKAQAATAGLDAARNWFGKKVKRVKVTVKAGYRILLRPIPNQH